MRGRLGSLALMALAGCGHGLEGDWNIKMQGTCNGRMTIQVTNTELTGQWSCSNAGGGLTGTLVGNAVQLSLSAPILRFPLQVKATLDGSSMNGTVEATDYPKHPFSADR